MVFVEPSAKMAWASKDPVPFGFSAKNNVESSPKSRCLPVRTCELLDSIYPEAAKEPAFVYL